MQDSAGVLCIRYEWSNLEANTRTENISLSEALDVGVKHLLWPVSGKVPYSSPSLGM